MGNPRKRLDLVTSEGDRSHKGRKRLRRERRPTVIGPFDKDATRELSPEALAVFDEAVEELNEMGLLGRCDRMLMLTMANAYADAQRSRREAETLRATAKRTRDVMQEIARQEKRASRELRLFLQCSDRLGLSPRARENLTIHKQDNSRDNLMKLLMTPRPTKRIDPTTGKMRDLDPITEEFVPEEPLSGPPQT